MNLADLKALARPTYRKLFHGETLERPSNLQIGPFGRFEIAYRSGTDKIIADNIESYRPEILAPGYRPSPRDTIINVGAHIGVSSLMAAAVVPSGKVFAIEASQDTFNFLRLNIALNRASNIEARRMAVADKAGSIMLYHDIGHWGHSVTSKLSSSSEIVEAVTLAGFMDIEEIEHCELLYLNCEGAEFPILLGSSEAALRKVDFITADIHCHLWSKNTLDDLIIHLQRCGFSTDFANDKRRLSASRLS